MRKKKNTFKIAVGVYVFVLVIAVLCLDDYVWTVLDRYEMTERRKEKEQRDKIQKALEERLSYTPTPTPSPTPTPAPIIMEQLKIVKPEGATLHVNGKPMEYPERGWVPEEDKKTFAVLLATMETYPEYEGLAEKLIPVLESTVITVEKGTDVYFCDADGTMVAPQESTAVIEVNGQERTVRQLTCAYQSDPQYYDELTAMGFDFLTKYCLFVSNDSPASEMRPFFPNNSQYYRTIASLDNSWFNGHDKPPEYTNKVVKSYVGYTDSLVCMELSMHQSFIIRYTGKRAEEDIVHPIWFVKINGEWKVATLGFTS